MNRSKKLVIFLLTVFCITGLQAQKKWVDFRSLSQFDKIQSAGNEHNGTLLYVARCKHNNSLTPAKVSKKLRNAHFAYGGKELQAKNYQLYVGKGKWKKAQYGRIPEGAIVCGYDSDQKPLYVARASYKGGVHIGKMKWGFKGVHISYGGREIELTTYEVLTDDYQWKKTNVGNLPVGAVVAGHSSHGNPAFVAKANLHGGVCPGYAKVDASCFPFNGHKNHLNDYQVVKGQLKWKKAKGRKIPLNAIVVGYERNGHPMFAAKVEENGKLLLGKMRDDFKGAHVLVGSREVEKANYKILVK